MKLVTIVFTKSKKRLAIFSKLIRWYTGKEYSHVARKGKISLVDKNHYFQASEGHVNYEYEDFFIKKHEIIKECTFEVSDLLYKNMIKTSWEQTGGKYGTMQNVGILLVDLLHYLGIRATNPFKKHTNCSELIYRTILKPMFPDLNYRADLIKPHEIEQIINDKILDNN